MLAGSRRGIALLLPLQRPERFVPVDVKDVADDDRNSAAEEQRQRPR